MDSLNPQSLQQNAQRALLRGREPKKVVLYYALISLVVSAASTLLSLWLDNRISDYGGLGNLNTRAIFSTAQQVLPILASVMGMCLQMGYLHAMMRISRGQYADQTDLKVGFQLFWPLLRMTLLLGFLYLGIALLAFQLSYAIFIFTPWAEPLVELLYPIAVSGGGVIDSATLAAATALLTPMLIMFIAVYILILLPFLFWFRMANFALLDNPRAGAMAALRASRKMMRRKFKTMLRIDLSLWPYYLMTVLLNLVLYADLILSMLGVAIPLDATVFSLILFGAALAIQFGIDYFLRNHAETTYILAYEQLREKPRDNSVVLGNIFDM